MRGQWAWGCRHVPSGQPLREGHVGRVFQAREHPSQRPRAGRRSSLGATWASGKRELVKMLWPLLTPRLLPRSQKHQGLLSPGHGHGVRAAPGWG